jgi:hypothetical protein
VTTSLTVRVDTQERAGIRLEEILSNYGSDLAALATRVALLEHQLAELRKGKEEWGRRLWAVLGPTVAALLGVLLGYFLHR